MKTVVDWAKKQPFYHEPYTVAEHSLVGVTTILYAENNDNISHLIPIAPVVSGQQWEDTCIFVNNGKKRAIMNTR